MAKATYVGMVSEVLPGGKYRQGATLPAMTVISLDGPDASARARVMLARKVLDSWQCAPYNGEFRMALYEEGSVSRYLVRYTKRDLLHSINVQREEMPADLQRVMDNIVQLQLSMQETIRLRGQQAGCLLVYDRQQAQEGSTHEDTVAVNQG